MPASRTREEPPTEFIQLGEALLDRVDEVVARQQAKSGELMRSESRDESAAITKFFAHWIAGSSQHAQQIDQVIDNGASDMASGGTSLRESTKLSFAWRDAIISVLAEEATRLNVSPEALHSAQAIVSASCDGFMVRLAKGYDLVRLELQRQLDAQHTELRQRALEDPLTRLPNRRALLERLTQAMDVARGHASNVAVIFFDLNGFKSINDRLGHAAGDRALNEIANRLSGCVGAGDIVGRLGGDEFVIICERSSLADAQAAADAITEQARCALRNRLTCIRETVTLTASIGVAFSDVDSTPDALLCAADDAMYRTKYTALRD
jgi:diguanylate cyclase (GGDEF)-like protein